MVKESKLLNTLTPGAFSPKNTFLDILEIFSLEKGQISSNLLKKGICNTTGCFLSTGTFYNIFAQAISEIKNFEKVTYIFRLFILFNFFSPFLFLLIISFCSSD